MTDGILETVEIMQRRIAMLEAGLAVQTAYSAAVIDELRDAHGVEIAPGVKRRLLILAEKDFVNGNESLSKALRNLIEGLTDDYDINPDGLH